MNRVVAISVIVLTGCVSSPATLKVFTLGSVEDGIRLRTEAADIEMAFAAVEGTVRTSDLASPIKERYLGLLRAKKEQRVFAQVRTDEVGSLLAELVAPVLLAHGRAVVIDRRRQQRVAFVRSGYSNRGEHGPYFCLPDGAEFLRQVIMVE